MHDHRDGQTCEVRSVNALGQASIRGEHPRRRRGAGGVVQAALLQREGTGAADERRDEEQGEAPLCDGHVNPERAGNG